MSDQFGNLKILAPSINQTRWTEAEALGSAVWLWMHSAAHRDMPLHALSPLLLPAIKNRQFILASENDKPVGYVAWAKMSEEAEARYLKQHPVLMPMEDWNCGDRLWFLDWIAPFGHSRAIASWLKHRAFAGMSGRTLDHRGDRRGFSTRTLLGARWSGPSADEPPPVDACVANQKTTPVSREPVRADRSATV